MNQIAELQGKSIEEIQALIEAATPEVRKELSALVSSAVGKMKWIPNPGPQRAAYDSQADVLLYGGQPGGGKTSLQLGLAFNCHQRSLILRRRYTDLGAIVEDMIKINGSRNGFNGQPPPNLRVSEKCLIELGAANSIGDEQHWMGQPHDLLCIDEATQFAEQQVRFLMGWVRSTDKKQRTRTVLGTNPPLMAEGLWVIQMFSPWLDPQHPNPASPGELRWVVTDENGKDKWVDGPQPVVINGRSVTPLSRTYIPASVQDNPFLSNTKYQAQLDALSEPYRSILMGGFMASFKDAENQIIPTDWVRQAQKRWTPKPPYGVPMSAMGVDPAAGGEAETAIACRYDAWYAPLICVPGKQTPLGSDIAGIVMAKRRDQALVILDMGGGYGGACYEHLKTNGVGVTRYRGLEVSKHRTKDRQVKFSNTRTAAYWRFREALDPDQMHGSPIMLPDDPALTADLTAPTFEPTPHGIKAESKEDVCSRLKRSTDRGDAVVMAWFDGPKGLGAEQYGGAVEMFRHLKRLPKVIMGHASRR